jgi:A/G-specific adenine glycosylase
MDSPDDIDPRYAAPPREADPRLGDPGADAVLGDPRPGHSREAALIALATCEGASPAAIAAFRAQILDHYARFGRDLPWRRTHDPYAVLVSEVMLQQTQVSRVLGRWERFLERFPGFDALAAAPLAEVLSEWQGLGYNRRAANLRRIAETVVRESGGALPRDPAVLQTLPGLGAATAASVSVFAYGTPVAFIETNVRAVYLHVFFADTDGVRDAELVPIAEAALDREDPDRWHWALMDYGVELKRSLPNPSRRSAHHARQGRFEGSSRQLRGKVLRALLAAGPLTFGELEAACDHDPRLGDVLEALTGEGLVTVSEERYSIG